MAVSSYPSGAPAVVMNSRNLSLSVYDDLPRKVCLASFRSGIGFVSFQDGTPRAIFTESGFSLCSSADGSATETWEWKAKTLSMPLPLSIALNSYLQFVCIDKHQISITFRSGKSVSGTEIFNCGAPGSTHTQSYLDKANRDATGALRISLDSKKHPTLVERQQKVSDPAKAAVSKAQQMNDCLPRLSSSGRELAGLELPSTMSIIQSNHEWTTGPLANFTTDIGKKVKKIKEKTCSRSFKKQQQDNEWAISPYATISSTVSPAESANAQRKRKLFTPRKVQLLTMAGLNIIKYAQSVRSDQLLVVCATDKTSKDCGQAVITLKEYLSASLNEVLVQRQLCASDVDVAKLTDELDTQIVLAECLTDKTLPKKFGFNLFPMFLFFYGGRLVFLGNRFNNGVCSLRNFEIQIQRTFSDARDGFHFPADYMLPSLTNATFESIFR